MEDNNKKDINFLFGNLGNYSNTFSINGDENTFAKELNKRVLKKLSDLGYNFDSLESEINFIKERITGFTDENGKKSYYIDYHTEKKILLVSYIFESKTTFDSNKVTTFLEYKFLD